jgi:hypothetical protein
MRKKEGIFLSPPAKSGHYRDKEALCAQPFGPSSSFDWFSEMMILHCRNIVLTWGV